MSASFTDSRNAPVFIKKLLNSVGNSISPCESCIFCMSLSSYIFVWIVNLTVEFTNAPVSSECKLLHVTTYNPWFPHGLMFNIDTCPILVALAKEQFGYIKVMLSCLLCFKQSTNLSTVTFALSSSVVFFAT